MKRQTQFPKRDSSARAGSRARVNTLLMYPSAKQRLALLAALPGVILLICLPLIPMPRTSAAGGVSLTTLGTAYTQNFDTLPASGSATWTNDSTIPGWYHARTGTGTTIVANDGTSNAGNLYSYGTGTATDRALGSVGSGNAAAGNFFWGVRLANNTGSTITSLDVSYTGEQWRNSAAAAQTVSFSYLVGSPTVTGSLAEFQSAGVAVSNLDFTSPITGGTAGALNGNLAANRTTLSFTINGLSIPNGTEVMLRWSDPDHPGADHGLAIDDFSVTPHGAASLPNLTINDVSLNEGNAGTTTFTFTVSLSAPAGPGGVTFDIATADGTATAPGDYTAKSLTGQIIPAGSSTYSFDVLVNGDTTPETNETFFVNITNVTGANVTDGQGQGTIVNDDVAPNLTINDVTMNEGDSGTTTFTFTVSLSQPAGVGGVTFDIATANGTATAPSDYTAKTLTSQTIPAGSSTYTFDVLVNGDTTVETDETFFVNVTNVTNAIVVDGQGLGMILNDDFTPIHDIQGSGDTSPLVGTSVTTRGIVTGVRSNGYFIEAPDAQWDANPSTSEGIFVFTSSAPPAAATVGNLVTVIGTVSEFIPNSDPNSPSVTELTSPTTSLSSTGNTMPTAITITTADTNPAGSIRQLEKYAGMRVHVDTLNVVGPTGGTINEANATSTSNGTFYGVLPGIGRPFREPGIQAPDPIPNPPCCIPRFDLNPERIRVSSSAVGGTAINVTAGATVSNLTGPLDYGFRAYTIDPEPATMPSVSGNVTFTAVPAPTATEFTVGCQNLERFFDNVSDGNGAVTLTTTAYNNRLNKASLLIRNVLRAPDILGVEEAETLTGLQTLTTKVNNDAVAAAQPNPNYQAYLLNGNDVGGINVGFLINATRVTVNGVAQAAGSLTATYTNPNNNQQELIFDRPPLVLDATVIGPPAVNVIVIVNHLRSLSGIDDPADGNRVRTKRRAGAEWLANYVQSRQTGNPNERLVLVGDFNAFEFNDGYADVMGTIKGVPTSSNNVLLASSDLVTPDLINLNETGTATDRYSFNFDGNAQSLDHILINNNAALNFSRFSHGRVNADFPEFYRNDTTRPERISDHDGEVAYFSYTPTAHFDISLPPSVTADTAFSGTVTVRDGFNNVFATYNGTVHFISSDGAATLPIDYTFNGGDAGTHTFTNEFMLHTAGPQSITATDTLSPSITGAANTTVTCPSINVTATNNGPICAGSTLQLDATDIPGATYSWTGPNGFTAAVRNPSIASATTAATGMYSVTISNAGCIYNASTSATVDSMPTTPTITGDTNGTGTQDQACPEQPLTLHANSTGAQSYQWYENNDTLNGETGPTLIVTGTATYYVKAFNGTCTTPQSAGYVVQNPSPHSPFISPRNNAPTTFCQGGSVLLDSNSATGIQWYKDGVAIPGANSMSYTATTSGTYTAQLNALGCHSQFGNNVVVTVNPLPPTPTINAGGPTTFCQGGSVTLTSSSASGNQWKLNGSPIGGATGQTYNATASGSYTVTVTDGNGCSATSSATAVTVTPPPTTATAGPNQTIPPGGTTAGLGGNTPTTGTGTWTVQSGGTGTFSGLHAGNSTFTHTGGSGPIVLRWTISNPPCPDSFAQVTIQIGVAPTISCPGNISVNADANQCSASVMFNPTTTGVPTPTVTCKLANNMVISSPYAFPVGATTVTCAASNGVAPDANCSFTVMVKDMQLPVFTGGCPVNVTATASASCPLATGKIVTYPTPAATDNCGTPAVSCNPPSGSIFPAGTTTVTCTTTDASNNMAQCTFVVTVFSLCLQDETNAGNFVIFNPVTGDYQFFCNEVLIASGTGTPNVRGCAGTITHAKGDRRILISFDTTANGGKGSGTASIQFPVNNIKCAILDKDMSNNACSPPAMMSAPERGRERTP